MTTAHTTSQWCNADGLKTTPSLTKHHCLRDLALTENKER